MSDAIGIAKLETHMELLLKGQDRADQSRKELYQTVNHIDKKVDSLDYRMTSLENEFKEAKPTIAEFVATKNKVAGAGMLGKWLWAFGGFVLGAAAWLTGAIEAFKNLGK